MDEYENSELYWDIVGAVETALQRYGASLRWYAAGADPEAWEHRERPLELVELDDPADLIEWTAERIMRAIEKSEE